MTTGSFEKARRGAMWIIGLQLAVTLLAAMVATLTGGTLAGYSALLGGLINVVASFYMARRVFAGGLAAGPRLFERFLKGEALKLVITVGLFIMAIVTLKAMFLPLILAYIATFVAYWAGLLTGTSFGRTR